MTSVIWAVAMTAVVAGIMHLIGKLLGAYYNRPTERPEERYTSLGRTKETIQLNKDPWSIEDERNTTVDPMRAREIREHLKKIEGYDWKK